MVRITIDESLQQRLAASGELVELCDETGRLIGRFVPEKGRSLPGWTPVLPHLSDEEIQRRLGSNERGLTTQEVKDHLRKNS